MLTTSEQIHEIATACAAAQQDIENIEKTGKNPHFRSSYATLPDVLAEVRPKYAKHGVAIIQCPVNVDSNIGVVTRFVHSSGQWIEGLVYVAPGKFDAQAVGSVITYLRRYALMAMGCVSGADDDGEAAVAVDAPKRASRHAGAFSKSAPGGFLNTPGDEPGKELAEWASGTAPLRAVEVDAQSDASPLGEYDALRADLNATAVLIARKGSAELRHWWENVLTKAERKLLGSFLRRYQGMAQEADEAAG